MALALKFLAPHGSLGRRLSIALTVGVVASYACFAAVSLHLRRREGLEAADQQMVEQAASLALAINTVSVQGRPEALSDVAEAMALGHPRHVQGLVLYSGGRVVVASRTVRPLIPALTPVATEVSRSGRGVLRPITAGVGHLLVYGFPLNADARPMADVGVVVRDLGGIDRALRRSFQRMMINAVLVVLVVVGLVLTLTRRLVTVPVGLLLEGVHRIASGDLETPLVLHGDDEISSVGTAVDDMRRALVETRAQLAQDIAHRVELETKMETERRLQHAQRLSAIGQIAAGLAHEIGSPLHVIAGRARYGASRTESTEQRENLEVIATQADRITGVVQQLLTVARKRQPRSVELDLRGVIESVVTLVGPQARQQGVALTVDGGNVPLLAEGDPDAFQQVFFNLVLNGLQAQPTGGALGVSAHQGTAPDSLGAPRERLIVEVRDQGPGIAPAMRERIFEPFATSKTDGTGLGLAIARGILRDHGGTIDALEPADGGPGALFRVTLPLAEERRKAIDERF